MKRLIATVGIILTVFAMSACDPTDVATILPATENPPAVSVSPSCLGRHEMMSKRGVCVDTDLRREAYAIKLDGLGVGTK